MNRAWGACARAAAMRFAGAFEVDLPDLIRIGRAQNRGEVNDRRDALRRRAEGLGVQDVAPHGRDTSREFLAGPHEGAALDARIQQAWEKT